MRRGSVAIVCSLAVVAASGPAAHADFPYGTGGPAYHDPAPQTPNDLGGDGNTFKFAATPEGNTPDNEPVIQQPSELCGIRGAWVADAHATYPFLPCPGKPTDSPTTKDVHTAWEVTTGRPEVSIAVLDSGIKWHELDSMQDLRHKVRLNKGELPPPQVSGPFPGVTTPTNDPYVSSCAGFKQTGDDYDVNNDGVFNVTDYACDPRVDPAPAKGVGPTYPTYWPDAFAAGKPVLDPQDVIIAFSDGKDADGNGYVDDIAGWDFLDDDNDPYDDVHYGHGTGEAMDSSAEANNEVSVHNPADTKDPTSQEHYGDQTGACPNCMVVPLRVGDSFIADDNRFGSAALYAVDNDVQVIQEALGTLNNTKLARDAVDYAYRHGVTVIASAADEAAQHHNWPSSLPHTIVVNSVRNYDSTTTAPKSYLRFNGCTNFSSKITVAIPSTSCSSNATGLAAGMAGLVYSAALDARDAKTLERASASDCDPLSSHDCYVTPNEVRQLMASGKVGSTRQSDDVNFASGNGETEPVCGTSPTPGCTNPFGPPGTSPFTGALQALVDKNHPVGPIPATEGYPARKGHDQFYGWGRVNAYHAVEATRAGNVPPEVEITSPEWFDQIDPAGSSFDLRGQVFARGAAFTCRVLVAPGSYPNDDEAPAGDFRGVDSSVCDGKTVHTDRVDGVLASISPSLVKGFFPTGNGSFDGPESAPGEQNGNGRPNIDKYGFVVKVVASTAAGGGMTGEDRRNLYLHHDKDLLPGFPKQLIGDGESSPLFVDLDGDNRNEMVFASADGIVHAWHRDGSELAGWPVHTDKLGLAANHAGTHAFSSGEVSNDVSGAVLASLAAGDVNGDGIPEVVGADWEGKVYVWDAEGHRMWTREANPNWSGKPLEPFKNVRLGQTDRTQHGFIASPVIADLNGDHKPEIVAAGMDRHLYAWHADGSTVDGFPVLVVDRDKVQSIDPVTHHVQFKDGVGADHQQGPLVDTPAVADLTGDGKAEIVVGSNEEYSEAINVGNFELGPAFSLLSSFVKLGNSNSRLFAVKSDGEPGGPLDGSKVQPNTHAYIDGWPFKVAQLQSDLLPIVGEGITGAPVIGPASMMCPASGDSKAGPRVGVIPDAGLGYVLTAHAASCAGNGVDGKPNAMRTENTDGSDHPVFPAVGHPAFGNFGGGVSFLAPVAGLTRALDVAASEYQTGGQDSLAAWNPQTGAFQPNTPLRVNDLQFLTGPSLSDVDSTPGEELLGGSAYLDLQGYTQAGTPATGFPKLTSDWMVANPLIGSWGTLDTDAAAKKVVVALTRSGSVLAYTAGTAPCSGASWPRFHHDNANSGFFDRDAVAPGTPVNAHFTSLSMTFTAPGDDLMCGKVDHYELVQSNSPITPQNFSQADPLSPSAPVTIADPGKLQSIGLPSQTERFVAARPVDDQGNVGRPAALERFGAAGGGGSAGTGAGAGNGGGGGSGGGACRDRLRPIASISSLRLTRHRFSLTGRARDRGCGANNAGSVRRTRVALAEVVRGGCRFVNARGHLGRRRSCRRQLFLTASSKGSGASRGFRLRRRFTLPPGRYVAVVRAFDVAGNSSRPAVRRLRLR
jgi:hypothetical protein